MDKSFDFTSCPSAARDGNVGHAVTRVGCRGQRGRRLAPLETQTKIEALLMFRRNLPLRRDGQLRLLLHLHLRRVGAAVRYIMPQRRAQFFTVVGEDLRVVCAVQNSPSHLFRDVFIPVAALQRR